eukprot:1153084-Pelagomonas_calceolata.AAC.1
MASESMTVSVVAAGRGVGLISHAMGVGFCLCRSSDSMWSRSSRGGRSMSKHVVAELHAALQSY